jgi:hypothetical protein
MGQVIDFPEKEELKNYKLIRSIYMSQTQRNKKARKRFFSWWGTELKKFVKDAQDMIRDAEKEVDDQANIKKLREENGKT